MSGNQIFKVRSTDRTGEFVPLADSSVPAGFPSPSEDYIDWALDFNELLIENSTTTFAVKIVGESMNWAGLFPGDIASSAGLVRRPMAAWFWRSSTAISL